jgi:hypothetical protein
MKKSPRRLASLRIMRTRWVDRLPDMERLLRGSLVERFKKCGKPGCHCVRGPGHGPAIYLSVTLGPGKTRSYYVPKRLSKQVGRYLDNFRRMREIIEEITRLNRELLAGGNLDDHGGRPPGATGPTS